MRLGRRFFLRKNVKNFPNKNKNYFSKNLKIFFFPKSRILPKYLKGLSMLAKRFMFAKTTKGTSVKKTRIVLKKPKGDPLGLYSTFASVRKVWLSAELACNCSCFSGHCHQAKKHELTAGPEGHIKFNKN